MPSRTTLGLLLLALCALSLRVAAVVVLAPRPDATRPARPVAYEHGEIAGNLVTGRGFTTHFLGVEGPTSQQAPFYPVLVAIAYRCCGTDSPQAVLAIQGLQCVVGTLLVLCVVWLSWSLVPGRRSLGWIAGWGAAIYPIHVYMVTHLQVAIWAAMLLTLLLAVVAERRWRGRRSTAIAAGVLSGALLLVEPILALVLPVIAGMFWLASRRQARSEPDAKIWPLARTGLMAFTALLVVSPWLVRNYQVHGEFVFIKSTFGYAFWQGNNPSSWGTDKIPKASSKALQETHDGTLAGRNAALWEARHETLYIDDVLLKPAGYAAFAGLSEPERSRKLLAEACEFIRQEPLQYAKLCLQRLRYFLLFDETNPKTSAPEYRVATVVWLVLGFVGLWIARPHWRALAPTMLIFAIVTLFHTLTITSARFRIPLEPIGLLWGAEVLAPLLSWFGPRTRTVPKRRRPPAKRAPKPAKAAEATQHVVQGPHWRFRKSTRDAASVKRRSTDL